MKITIKLAICFLRIIYFFIKIFPTKKKIVFISRQSNSCSLDMKLLIKQIKIDLPYYRIIALTKKLENGYNSTIKMKINYSFHILVQMYHIATSKVVILDSYCIPISILKHKKTLKVIQMWHSIGTMKKFGYSILNQPEGTSEWLARVMGMHRNYNYIFASSKEYKKHLSEGFDYPISKILTFPLPRIDLLMDYKYQKKRKIEITKKYCQLKNKKNILYCPTFRKDETELKENIEKLIDKIDYKRYNLIVKLHPLSKIKINDSRVIFDLKISTFDMLSVADYVISDYSCIVYEAAMLLKPLYFYTFDINNYIDKRDMYIDYYKEMPGIITDDVEKLVCSILNNEYDLKKVEKFSNKYIEYHGQNCTKKIVDFIKSFL